MKLGIVTEHVCSKSDLCPRATKTKYKRSLRPLPILKSVYQVSAGQTTYIKLDTTFAICKGLPVEDWGLPWWSGGRDFVFQCRGFGFNPWSES